MGDEKYPNNDVKDSMEDRKFIEVPYRLNENIYNAFLLLRYRPFDFDFSRTDEHNNVSNLRFSLGIIAYVISIAQFAALVSLCRVVMLESGMSLGSTMVRNYYSYLLFPFLLFGMISAAVELRSARRDIEALQEFGIGNGIKYREGIMQRWHVFYLKKFSEVFFGWAGSLAYFMVLALYSTVNDWAGVLKVILNFLAHKNILEADELAYTYFAKDRIAALLARAGKKEIDIFEGHIVIPRKVTCSESYWIYADALLMIIICVVFQEIYRLFEQ